MIIKIKNESEMVDFGARLGALFDGGEVIELIGDVGAGKTTLARGIATGLRVAEDIQSPSFTISRLYDARDNLTMAHYDFYRLNQPGIMSDDLDEAVHDRSVVTIIEWSQIVSGVLPDDRLSIRIKPISETARELSISATGKKTKQIEEKL